MFKPLQISLALCLAFTSAVEFPNSISTTPEVSCKQQSIALSVTTSNGLPARIFVKGHTETAGCFVENDNKATFALTDCNMIRKRQIDPRGVEYSMVVVVQLHPLFITKVDRAYHVQCFYMEADKSVTASLDVSVLTTINLDASSPMPQCQYSLHADGPNGAQVRFARIGDKVWHVWECESDAYGMLVHSCFVQDQRGNRIMVLDENGCGIDRYVMQTPVYAAELTRVQQETHVFKFADKLTVAFECSIKLCLKNEGQCNEITPPKCVDSQSSSRLEPIIQTTATSIVKTESTTTTTTSVSSTSSEATSSAAILGNINSGVESVSTEPHLRMLTNEPPLQILTTTSVAEENTTVNIITMPVNNVEGSGEDAESSPSPLPSSDAAVFGNNLQISNDADLESIIDAHEPNAYWRTARLEDERGDRPFHDSSPFTLLRAARNDNKPLETDVNQELVVLDHDQSDALASALTDRKQTTDDALLQTLTRSTDAEIDMGICVSMLGFSLLIGALCVLLLLCGLVVVLLIRHRPSRLNHLVASMSDSDSISPASSAMSSSRGSYTPSRHYPRMHNGHSLMKS